MLDKNCNGIMGCQRGEEMFRLQLSIEAERPGGASDQI